MSDERATETSLHEAPPRTRDWVWGLVVVVGVTVLAVAGAIWILANLVLGTCCTQPAPGY